MHALQQQLLSLPSIFRLQTVFLEDANGFRIDKREIGARKDYRHAPEQLFVEHLRLRVSRQFRRVPRNTRQ